jgi:osmotically-inducible protein OsmY
MMKQPKYLLAVILTAFMATPLLATAADAAAVQAADKIPPAANDKMVPAETPDSMPNSAKATNASSDAASVDDATITKNVKKALASNADIAKQKVQVETSDGVVTVTGQVNDQQHTSKIVQVIASVKGVKSVNNQITMGNS